MHTNDSFVLGGGGGGGVNCHPSGGVSEGYPDGGVVASYFCSLAMLTSTGRKALEICRVSGQPLPTRYTHVPPHFLFTTTTIEAGLSVGTGP